MSCRGGWLFFNRSGVSRLHSLRGDSTRNWKTRCGSRENGPLRGFGSTSHSYRRSRVDVGCVCPRWSYRRSKGQGGKVRVVPWEMVTDYLCPYVFGSVDRRFSFFETPPR